MKKRCPRCKKIQSIDNFYLSKSTGYYLSYCKQCQTERVKERLGGDMRRRNYCTNERLKKLQKIDREYQRRKRAKNKEDKKLYTQSYKEKYPERYEAAKIFSKALRDKEIERKPCEECGRKDSQGHHPDYSKPLRVKWLCPIHHKLEHEKLKKEVKQESLI